MTSNSRVALATTAVTVVLVGLIALAISGAIGGSHSTGAGSGDPPSGRAASRRAASSPATPPAVPRWYSPRSLWNTPIPAHARIAPNSASLIAALERTNGIGPAYNYTPAIWYATTQTKKVRVRIDAPRCGARTVWVPIPNGTVPDPSPEGHMAIAQYSTGREYDFYRAQLPDRPPKSSLYYSRACPRTNEWTAAKVVTTNWLTGNGELRGSVRGSGTPEGSGLILPRDLRMPATSSWGHALAMAYKNTCSHALSWCPVVAPATQEDGSCTNRSSCVPEGARFQLDPSVDCETWPSLHYVWQRQMCRTFQVYGGIIIDTNESGPTVGNQWWGSLGRYRWPWLTSDEGIVDLPNDLLPHFRVLAWR